MELIHPLFDIGEQKSLAGISYEEYRAIEAVNSGGLMKMSRSPAHYFEERINPSESTPAQLLGIHVHMAALEWERWKSSVVAKPDFGTGEGSRKRKWAWEAELAPGIIVCEPEYIDKVELMARKLHAHPKFAALFTGAACEVVLIWKDPVTGLWCKARLDLLTQLSGRPVVLDVKTTTDASYEKFSKQVWNMQWDLQAAQYTDGARAHYGVEPLYVWAAVESKPPHEVQLFVANEATIEHGQHRRGRAIKRLARCIKEQKFPGYGEELVNLSLPHSAWYDLEDIDEEEEVA